MRLASKLGCIYLSAKLDLKGYEVTTIANAPQYPHHRDHGTVPKNKIRKPKQTLFLYSREAYSRRLRMTQEVPCPQRSTSFDQLGKLRPISDAVCHWSLGTSGFSLHVCPGNRWCVFFAEGRVKKKDVGTSHRTSCFFSPSFPSKQQINRSDTRNIKWVSYLLSFCSYFTLSVSCARVVPAHCGQIQNFRANLENPANDQFRWQAGKDLFCVNRLQTVSNIWMTLIDCCGY